MSQAGCRFCAGCNLSVHDVQGDHSLAQSTCMHLFGGAICPATSKLQMDQHRIPTHDKLSHYELAIPGTFCSTLLRILQAVQVDDPSVWQLRHSQCSAEHCIHLGWAHRRCQRRYRPPALCELMRLYFHSVASAHVTHTAYLVNSTGHPGRTPPTTWCKTNDKMKKLRVCEWEFMGRSWRDG
jgi:hypothetical protein